MNTLAILLALFLIGMAAWDLRGPVRDRDWRMIAAYAVLWVVGTVLAVVEASGVELPTVGRILVRMMRPLSRWVP